MTNTPRIGFIGSLKSIFAAFFGVQAEEQRERDFAGGKPIYFILAGLFWNTDIHRCHYFDG